LDEATKALVAGLMDQGFSEQHAIEYLKASGHPMSEDRPFGHVAGTFKDHRTTAKDIGMDLEFEDAEVLISDVSSAMGCSMEEAVRYLQDQGYTVDGFSLSETFEVAEEPEEPDDFYDEKGTDEPSIAIGCTMQGTSASRQYFLRLKKALDEAMEKADDLGSLLGAMTEQGLLYSAGQAAPVADADPVFGDYTVKKSDCVLTRSTSDCGNKVQFTILPDGELRAYWVVLTP